MVERVRASAHAHDRLGLGSQNRGRQVELRGRRCAMAEQPLGARLLEHGLVGVEVARLREQLEPDGSLALVFGAPVLVPGFHLSVG